MDSQTRQKPNDQPNDQPKAVTNRSEGTKRKGHRIKRKATSKAEAENERKQPKRPRANLLLDVKIAKRKQTQVTQEANVSDEVLIPRIWPDAFPPPQPISNPPSAINVIRESSHRWVKIDDDILAEEIMHELIDISDESAPPNP